jgi:hypothetical protein
MSENFLCYRCGTSLAALSLPISRYDECPSCAMQLRVCRMCSNYAPDVPKKCREDDAEEVLDKERLTFCEWFTLAEDAFSGKEATEEARARDGLSALFGDETQGNIEQDPATQSAEDLFK